MELVSDYLRFHKVKVLPKEETYDLIKKAQRGCMRSREKLIIHNIPLVMNLANRHYYGGTSVFSYEDLFQEGITGLMRAIELFDTKRGLHFSTYAEPWIRQKVMRYVDDNRGPVRTPVYLQAIQKKYRRLKEEDNHQHTDEFYIQYLAKKNNLSIPSLRHKVSRQASEVRIDDPLELHQLSEIVDEEKMNLALFDFKFMLDQLDERERFIMERRMNRWTLQQISEQLDVSRERVRQLETKALAKLKAMVSDVAKNNVFELREKIAEQTVKKPNGENIIEHGNNHPAAKKAKELEARAEVVCKARKRDRRILTI